MSRQGPREFGDLWRYLMKLMSKPTHVLQKQLKSPVLREIDHPEAMSNNSDDVIDEGVVEHRNDEGGVPPFETPPKVRSSANEPPAAPRKKRPRKSRTQKMSCTAESSHNDVSDEEYWPDISDDEHRSDSIEDEGDVGGRRRFSVKSLKPVRLFDEIGNEGRATLRGTRGDGNKAKGLRKKPEAESGPAQQDNCCILC